MTAPILTLDPHQCGLRLDAEHLAGTLGTAEHRARLVAHNGEEIPLPPAIFDARISPDAGG